jgi:hypothetical protein
MPCERGVAQLSPSLRSMTCGSDELWLIRPWIYDFANSVFNKALNVQKQPILDAKCTTLEIQIRFLGNSVSGIKLGERMFANALMNSWS